MRPIPTRLALIAALLLTALAPLLTAAQPPRDCHDDPLPDGALARLGTTRLRHADGICQVLYSADGAWLASLSRDRICRVWEAGTGRLQQQFAEKDVDFYSAAFAPDRGVLALAAGDPFHGGNTGIRLIDVRTGKELHRFEGHHQPAYSVSFSPDGATLVSVSCDQVIRWNVAAGAKLSEWKLPTTAALAVAPNRAALAWIDGENEDKTIHLGDATTGKEIRKFKGQHKRAVVSVAFSPDGKTLASGNPFEPIHLWDVATGKVIRKFEQTQGGMALKFATDGKTLVCGCMDGKVRVWDVATGVEKTALVGYRGWVNNLAFAPDGGTLALAGADSQVIHRWRVATGEALQAGPGHHGQIYTVAFSPNGQMLATGGGDWHDHDQGLYLWDAASGKPVRKLEGHTGKVYCVHFSPDGKTLVSGSEKEEMFRLWDAASGQALKSFEGRPAIDDGRVVESRVSAVAFAPGGKLLASAHDQGVIHLWDAVAGKHLRTLRGHEGVVNSIAFSPDGTRLASGSVDRSVRVWDVASAEEVLSCGDRADSVKCVQFSPDGRLLAASSGDYEGTVYLWDAANGHEVAHLAGSKSRIYQIAFSPDGKLLAGTGPENTLCVWEVATRQERCHFPGHPTGGLAVAFSPDGSRIAAGSQDTTVMVWKLTHCPNLVRPRSDADLQQLWTDLGSSNASVAHRAMCALQAEPAAAIKLLQQRLRPVSAMDADRLAKALDDLDHDRFPVREKATNELAKLGEMAEPFLRRTLEGEPSLEVQRRVQILLNKLETATLAPDQLRALRGFEVLERIGGGEARGLFEAHAREAATGRLGREAQACLQRLRP